jgi:hypothetical protein
MKLPLLCFAAALALYACSREEPAVGQTMSPNPASQNRAATRIDETRQVEKAADAGKPLSDASLAQIVRSALESDSSLDSRKIDVENRNGSVALYGSVETEAQREKAARIVGSVGGVRDVTNNLSVDPSAATGGTSPGTSPKKDYAESITPRRWKAPGRAAKLHLDAGIAQPAERSPSRVEG